MEDLKANGIEATVQVRALVFCASLQILDFLTTAVFLARGVAEANPVVRTAMETFSNPLLGLALAKAFGLTLVLACWKLRRPRILKKINTGYALLIVWNVVALVVATLNATRVY